MNKRKALRHIQAILGPFEPKQTSRYTGLGLLHDAVNAMQKEWWKRKTFFEILLQTLTLQSLCTKL